MSSIPFREPRDSKAGDKDVESETIEQQQVPDRTKGTGMDQKTDDGTLDPRTLQDDTSEHYWATVNPALLMKQGESSTVVQGLARAGLKELDEMEVCNDSDDDTAVNEDEGFGVEIARVSSRRFNMDVGADNTEEFDAVDTTVFGEYFSDGYYVQDDIADNTEEVGADDAGVPIGQDTLDDDAQPQCDNTEGIDVNNTADCVVHVSKENDNTWETSGTRLATSGEDIFNDLEKSPSNANAPQIFTAGKNNENPAQEHQPPSTRSTVGIYHSEESEPAEESEETSNSKSTSTGTESSKESDKMSETTEVPNNVEIQPFNFLGCPDNVRHLILRHVLESKKAIRPYYNFGALELPAHQATRENYATDVVAAFTGDAALVEQVTTVLYGENDFHLRDAKIALWWLRRIGPANVSKLQYLSVALDEGVTDHFGTRRETLWRQAFALLHRHQRLHSLAIGFQGWTMRTNSDDGLSSEDGRVWRPRYAILRMLLQWRGLEEAEMAPGGFVTREYARLLVDAVIMQPGETSGGVRRFEDLVKAPVRSKYSFA